MTGAVNFDWTPERVERLGKLAKDGLTAAKIAADLGAGLTRNAVLGKLHRLRSPADSQYRRWSDADRAKIVTLVIKRKMLTAEVAAELEAGVESVREQIKALKKVGRIPADALSRNYEDREQARRSALIAEPKPKPKIVPKPKPIAKVIAKPEAPPASRPKPAVAPSIPAAGLLKVVRDVFMAPADAYLVTIHELREIGLDCRWPYTCDDGQTRYCGKPATDGSWCQAHATLAYAGDARPTMKPYAPAKSGRGLAMQRGGQNVIDPDLGPTCATCLAFHADGDERVAGECRCYAPKPCTTETLNWPVVDGDDWCLQHRQTTAPFELTFVPVAIDGGAGD